MSDAIIAQVLGAVTIVLLSGIGFLMRSAIAAVVTRLEAVEKTLAGHVKDSSAVIEDVIRLKQWREFHERGHGE